jgi:hypothetical protein
VIARTNRAVTRKCPPSDWIPGNVLRGFQIQITAVEINVFLVQSIQKFNRAIFASLVIALAPLSHFSLSSQFKKGQWPWQPAKQHKAGRLYSIQPFGSNTYTMKGCGPEGYTGKVSIQLVLSVFADCCVIVNSLDLHCSSVFLEGLSSLYLTSVLLNLFLDTLIIIPTTSSISRHVWLLPHLLASSCAVKMSTTAVPQLPKWICMISWPYFGKLSTALYVNIRLLTLRFIAACLQV